MATPRVETLLERMERNQTFHLESFIKGVKGYAELTESEQGGVQHEAHRVFNSADCFWSALRDIVVLDGMSEAEIAVYMNIARGLFEMHNLHETGVSFTEYTEA